ncbi:hypothetical protein P3W45_000670 [Vairimorpha bombi]|jgi:tRNA-dihydrouridine synthase A
MITYSDNNFNKEISLAPMLDVTTANFRKLVRISSEKTVIFTEMIVSSTVLHIETDKLRERLGLIDNNTVVQIGGSDPEEISNAVIILQNLGCTHFNLNVGCPSSRVQKGCFGAILMKDKYLVSDIVNSVYTKCKTVISLKIRTGVNDCDTYDFFKDFVSHIITNTPVSKFYVHARKCWLSGLSPKQNRTVPPLNYDFVYRIKEDFPHIKFILNGGLKGIEDIEKLKNLDGMMIGREAIKNILVFTSIDEHLYGTTKINVNDILCQYLKEFDGNSLANFRILGPIQHILYGQKGTKKFKIFLNEAVRQKYTLNKVIEQLEQI